MSNVAILIPSLNRPHKLKEIIDNLKGTTTDYTLYFIFEKEDKLSQETAKSLDCEYLVSDGGSFGSAINHAFLVTREPYLFLSADDCVYHAGWLDEALKLMTDDVGVVGTNDLSGNPVIVDGKMSVNSLVSRKYLDEFTGTMDRSYPFLYNYGHNYTDQELVETAQFRGKYAHAHASHVEHRHWVHKTAPMDSTYQIAIDRNGKDTEIFNSRKHMWGK